MANTSSPTRTSSTGSPPAWPSRQPLAALSASSVSDTPCVRSGPLSCCSPLMPGLLSRALQPLLRRPPQEEPERGREQQQRERREPLRAERGHGRDRRQLGRAPS